MPRLCSFRDCDIQVLEVTGHTKPSSTRSHAFWAASRPSCKRGSPKPFPFALLKRPHKAKKRRKVPAVPLGQAQGGYLPFFLAAFFAFFATVLASFSWKMDGRSLPSHTRSLPYIDSPSSLGTNS